MKIAVDIRSLQEGFHSGVQEYVEQLLRALWAIDATNEYVVFTSGMSSALPEDFLLLLQDTPTVRRVHLGLPNKLLNILFRMPGHSVQQLLGDPDVVFHPNISIAPLPVKSRQILTVHDLSFERHPEFFSRKRRLWHRLASVRTQVDRADTVIAVSESTAQDLEQLYGIEQSKISVIYSGINEQFLLPTTYSLPPEQWSIDHEEEIKPPLHIGSPYILSVGTIDPRKNPMALFAAFEKLKQDTQLDDLKLVMVGPQAWASDSTFGERITRSPVKNDIIVTGEIPSFERPQLYQNASAFAYPSFFEGFGFPPLEAMASGTPVVASFNSSLPEAVSSAGIMVDPYRPDELATALRSVLTDQNLAQRLIKKGEFHAKKFTWSQCASQVRELLSPKTI